MDAMQFLKKAARVLSSGLFKISIGLLAIFLPLSLTFGGPEDMKESLKNSGVYENAIDGAIDLSGQEDSQTGEILEENQKDQGSRPPASSEAIEAAAREALSPELLQTSAEDFLDGTYRWLDGEVDQPDFEIDLTEAKQNFANALADRAIRDIQEKPVCTIEQARNIPNIDEIDPYDLPCRPPNFGAAEIRDRVEDEILRSDEFLPDPVITAETLNEGEGEGPFEQENLPQTFQLFKRLPWIFGILALISGVGLILLHDSKRRAYEIVFRSFLVTGIIVLIAALVSLWLIGQVTLEGQFEASVELRNSALKIIGGLSNAFNQKIVIIGAVYIAVGAAGLFWNHKKNPEQSDSGTKEHEHQTDHAAESKTEHPDNDDGHRREDGKSKETKQKIASDNEKQ